MARNAATRSWLPVVGGALAMVLPFVGIVHAEYVQPDLEKVPLKRLIENLKEKIKAAPKDPELFRHLARTYAMAYAAGLDDDSLVERRKDRDQIWFGFEPAHVPFARRAGEHIGEKPKTYLEQAIGCYKKALELEASHLTTKLGLAWCTEQAGDKDSALKLYREVIAEAWKLEGSRGLGGMGEFVTVEAAGYLIRILDPKNDEKEIADLKAKVKHLESLPRPITPIAVPLQNGLSRAEMVDPNGAVFDLDGTGRKLRWQWVKPCAAWLVYDHDDSGLITSAVQMFGNRTFTLFLEHGYAAMALLDDDGNGTLDGGELEHLALWRDLNGNGTSEPGEVKPLSAWRIKALSCRAETGADGGWFCRQGVTFDDGSARPTHDLVLDPVE